MSVSYPLSVGVAYGSHSEWLACDAAGETTTAGGIRLRRGSRQGAALILEHRGG